MIATPPGDPASRPRTARLLTAPVLIALLALTTACQSEAPAPQPVLRPVRVMVVSDALDARGRTFAGTAQSGAESRLSFKVSGTLTEVAVKVGSDVKKGTLLARLDAADYELQVQEAVATYTQGQAQLRNAESTYDRTRDLYASRNASRQDLDQAQAARDSARATLYSIGKRLQLARSQVKYTRLVAPVDGVISGVLAEVNENVASGQPVVVLSSGDSPEVRFAVPEVFVARIKVGDTVGVTFDALRGERFEATVTEAGVSGTNTGSTFPITARVESPDDEIRPGMAAEVTVDFSTGEDGEAPPLRVPPFAVAEDAEARFVYLLEPGAAGEGVVRRRVVEVGDLTADGLAITRGLAPGDRLVTAGVTRLVDGQTVKVLPALAGDAAAAPAAPAPAAPDDAPALDDAAGGAP
ncbi:MAG: efflux RND transporter periplasmic adaptor subunit [Myxococcales bacterium]|nr:efflux RND transporter periplasmic adaptor subunit [Myxococcales bacterium]